MKTGKLIHLHWSAWLILGLQFLIQLTFLVVVIKISCEPVSPFIPMYVTDTTIVEAVLIVISSVCYMWGFILICRQRKSGWVLSFSPVLFGIGIFFLPELITPWFGTFQALAFIGMILAAVALIVIAVRRILTIEVYQVLTVISFFLLLFGIYHKSFQLGMWLAMHIY